MEEEDNIVDEQPAEESDYKEIPTSVSRVAKRARHLAQEASALKNENAQLRDALREREEALEFQQRALAEAEEQKTEAFETSLVQEEERILKDLRVAKATQDYDSDVFLTQELAKIKSDQAALDVTRRMPQHFPSYQEPVQQEDEDEYERESVNYRQEEDVQENENLLQFYINNPQADPESPHFDPQFKRIADIGADKLAEIYERNGESGEIGSPEFFGVLHSVIHKRELNERQVKADPGVSRNGSSMADVYASRNRTGVAATLTPQQLRIARNLSIPGRNMSEDEKIKIYAKHLADEANYEHQEL